MSLRLGLFVVCVVGLGVLLRSINLDSLHSIEADERSWHQVGLSLLRDGVPATWTIFYAAYNSPVVIPCAQGSGIAVRPYLDHPPVFSLLIGMWAYLVRQTDFCEVNWVLLRIPMIILAGATLILTFLFVRRFLGLSSALFALLAFTFFPSHVVASRFIATEHFIAFLLLLGLYCFSFWDDLSSQRSRNYLLLFLLVLCVVAPLVKLTGVVVPVSLILLACVHRRWHLALFFGLGLLFSFLLFFLYGWYYDLHTFLTILAAHHNRPQSSTHFWSFFTAHDLGNFPFFDPSVIVGLSGVFSVGVVHSWKRSAYIITPLIVLSFLFLWVAPVDASAWYRYVIYPFVAIGLGFVFSRLYHNDFTHLPLFLPLLFVMLDLGLLQRQDSLRIGLLILYGVLLLPMLVGSRFLPFRFVFVPSLFLLFFFETLWVAGVLGYPLF